MTEYKELYITSTESLYPGDTEFSEVVVRLYCRDKDDNAVPVTVTGFSPYFYTRADETEKVRPASHEDLVRYEEVDIDPLSERFDPDPSELVKVVARYPHAVRELRERYDTTWGADTIFTERFRIDHDIRTGVRVPTEGSRDGHIVVDKSDIEPVEIKDVEPRVLTLDIETDDRDAGFPDPGDARILSIAVHDSYDDEYTVFLDCEDQGVGGFFDLSPVERAKLSEGDLKIADIGLTEPDALVARDTEAQMLTAFSNYIRDTDPDIIAGWNSGDGATDGFDLPHIIERMNVVGLNPARISREGEVEVKERGDKFKPSVTGRALYDLMDGWADTKFTEPRSKKLDDVAADALDDAKIEHEDQGYYEMYRDDPVKFVNYNVKDTRLTVGVNQEEGVLSFKKRLKDIVGVDWRRTHQNNEFIEMAVRRKCAEHGVAMITAYDNEYVGGDTDEVNYEGAYVFSPFEGLRENVVGIDLESLYPRTQQMLNVSPDARIEKSKALVEDIPFVEAENGQAFRDDVDGIMRELITDYMKLKAKFKEERNEADPGTEEREKLAEIYSVTKTIVNSFYGYGGWNRSPLYNPHDAAAVTLTGQAVIKATAEYVNEETPGEVAYGDTDSVYCSWPDEWEQVRTLEYVDEVCDHLNDELYPNLCEEYGIKPENNRWRMELEKRGDFFMSNSKKRYAIRTTWLEGLPFDEQLNNGDGKVSITGYECVKSNYSLLTKETQEEILEKIVRGASTDEIVKTVHDAATSIDAKDPDWDRIGIPQGLGQKIDPEKGGEDDYYSWSTTGNHPRGEAPRAAWFANHLLEVKFEQGDKPMRAALKPTQVVDDAEVDVIAYNDSHDLLDVDLTVDAAEMQRKCLENPLEDILRAIDIEPNAAMQGKAQEQSGLTSFM